MTTDQLSPEDVQRVTDDLAELWLRLHLVERRLGQAERDLGPSGEELAPV